MQFLGFYPAAIHKFRRIVHAIPVFNRDLEYPPHDAERAIVTCRAVILAVTSRPIIAIALADFGYVRCIQFRPRFFKGGLNLSFIELRARFVVVVILDLCLKHFDDDFAFDGLALVDAQTPVILEKVRQFELGDGQHMGVERTAN